MRTFSFFTHPANINQAKKIWPISKIIPVFGAAAFLKNLKNFKVIPLKEIQTLKKEKASGFIIVANYLPDEIASLTESEISDKISRAAALTEKLGCDILGLGGLFAEKKFLEGKSFKFPVSPAVFLSAWTVIEAIYRLSRNKKSDLKELSATVIGASSCLGGLISKKLSFYFKNVILSGGQGPELKQLKEQIAGLNPQANVLIEPDMRGCVKNADFAVIAWANFSGLLKEADFKPGCIMVNISGVSQNYLALQKKNPNFIEAGLMKLPAIEGIPSVFAKSGNIIPAGLAEILLLTLEGKFVGRRFNDNNIERVEEIADIAVQHGLEVWLPSVPLL